MGKRVLITGPPGVGKTTLVKKIIESLKISSTPNSVQGFYTEELRGEGGQRVGFDVVTVDGRRGPLARVSSKSSTRVGNYGVEVEPFEILALSTFDFPQGSSNSAGKTLILDEIGKMEIFSQKFKTAVDKAFMGNNDLKIIATIPMPPKGKPILFIENIRKRPDCELFTVTKLNRDSILPEILALLS